MRYPELIVKDSKWNSMPVSQARAYLITKGVKLSDSTIRKRIAAGELDYYINEDNRVMIIDNEKLENQRKGNKKFVFKKQERLNKLLNNENDAFIRSDTL